MSSSVGNPKLSSCCVFQKVQLIETVVFKIPVKFVRQTIKENVQLFIRLLLIVIYQATSPPASAPTYTEAAL